MTIPRYAFFIFLALTLFATPASAQTATIQNGGTITVENGGVWDLSGTTVDLGGTGSTASITETSGGRFANGQLTATRTLNAPSDRNVAGLGAVITSSENLGETVVTRGHAVQTRDSHESIARYYDIDPVTNSGLDATLAFNYKDAELNGHTEGELTLFRSDDGGQNYTTVGHDSRDAPANTVTLGGIASFSRWTVFPAQEPSNQAPTVSAQIPDTTIDDNADPMALTLANYFSDPDEDDLTFSVAPANSGIVSAAIAEDTLTLTPQSIGETDVTVTAEDPDGATASTSFTVVVNDQVAAEDPADLPGELALKSNAPNPFAGETTIRYDLPNAAQVTLEVYDALGRRVATLVDQDQAAGRKQIRFDADELPAGVYVCRLTAGDFAETRRMLVVE